MLQELNSLKEQNRTQGFNQNNRLDDIAEAIKDIKSRTASSSGGMVQLSALQVDDLGFVASTLGSMVRIAGDLARAQVVLKGLCFSTMLVRYSKISEAHERTFTWVLKKNLPKRKKAFTRLRFIEWLESGDGIYWISGKPGSGKSTLMKFLSGHELTRKTLSTWAKPSKLLIASHYFWSAGTFMQKSQDGLLRSLVYEILRQCPELIPEVTADRWAAAATQTVDSKPWTLQELTQVLHRITAQQMLSTKFCFFIDGLDEYEGEHSHIIKFLRILTQSPNIKLCVSSRPWNIFEDAYGGNQERKLYLHELTHRDIQIFVKDNLEEHPSWSLYKNQQEEANQLCFEVTNKAQGVFLWVHLVVRSLKEGLTNGDSLVLLNVRLQRLPSDLEQFFKLMVESIESVYHGHMSRTFQTALEAPGPLTLMTYSFMDDILDGSPIGRSATSLVRPMDDYELGTRHSQMKRRLNGRCRGLLEVSLDPPAPDFFCYTVDFLHRTVRDFLWTKDMQAFLACEVQDPTDIHISMLKAFLEELQRIPAKKHHLIELGRFQSLLRDAMWTAHQIEARTGTSPTELLDEIEAALGNLETRLSCNILWYRGSDSVIHGDKDSRLYCSSFLEFAIQNGLQLYVKDRLDREQPLSETVMTEMLDCALLLPVLGHSQGEIDLYDMVRMLLDQGACPNAHLGTDSQSVINRFLLRLKRPFTDTSDAELHQVVKLIELLFSRSTDQAVLDETLVLGIAKDMLKAEDKSEQCYELYTRVFRAFTNAGISLRELEWIPAFWAGPGSDDGKSQFRASVARIYISSLDSQGLDDLCGKEAEKLHKKIKLAFGHRVGAELSTLIKRRALDARSSNRKSFSWTWNWLNWLWAAKTSEF